MRVCEGVYQRLAPGTGKPVPGKFEFTYREATGRQVWRTARGGTKAEAKHERAALAASILLGHRVERTSLTVGEAARLWIDRGIGARGRWDPATAERYRRIVARSVERSSDPGQRPIGAVRLRDLDVEAVAAWSKLNERQLAPTTAALALVALNQVCRFALRQGWLADNPVARLEPGEKPRWTPRPVRALDGTDLALLLDHAGSHRTLFEVLACTGLRIGEALGLRWCDLDLSTGLLRVRRQLSRHREPKKTKTEAALREIILAVGVVDLLARHRAAASHPGPEDWVFCTTTGRGLDHRHVGTAFRTAVHRAGLHGSARLSLHSLRHGYASTLISQGLNVVFVSRQLGHANPNITLGVYAHLFQHADHVTAARAALQASYQAIRAGAVPALSTPSTAQAMETTVVTTAPQAPHLRAV